MDPVLSAVEKARMLLQFRESLAGNKRAVHRAMDVDNGERGSAQKYRCFDADDLSALILDFDNLMAEVVELRKAVNR